MHPIEVLMELPESLTPNWKSLVTGRSFHMEAPTGETLGCIAQDRFLLCTYRTPGHPENTWPDSYLAETVQDALKWCMQKIANIPS